MHLCVPHKCKIAELPLNATEQENDMRKQEQLVAHFRKRKQEQLVAHFRKRKQEQLAAHFRKRKQEQLVAHFRNFLRLLGCRR